jgi:hypothetical protein
MPGSESTPTASNEFTVGNIEAGLATQRTRRDTARGQQHQQKECAHDHSIIGAQQPGEDITDTDQLHHHARQGIHALARSQ